MHIMKKSDLNSYGHDVYEFCTALNFSNTHWHENSIYITMEDFSLLSPYLDKVFKFFNYYATEKISLLKWESVINLVILENNLELTNFFKLKSPIKKIIGLKKQNIFILI